MHAVSREVRVEKREKMTFLILLLAAVVVLVAAAKVIRKHAVWFYGAAVAVVMVYLAGMNGLIDGSWWKATMAPVQRCLLAFALFTIVMYIGVLPKGSWLDARLRPIRAEVSLIACILCLGHVCAYAVRYAAYAFSGSLRSNMLLAFAVAVILFALLLLLGVTSISRVKQAMSGKSWKAVQRLAYLFFGCTYIHLLLVLTPAVLTGATRAVSSLVIYSVVFFGYVALRVYRARKESESTAELPESDCAEVRPLFEDDLQPGFIG